MNVVDDGGARASRTSQGGSHVGKDTPTGLPNHVYDLVLLLQQAAEDVVRYSGFATDAREAGDDELAQWCTELADSDREIVSRARRMLVSRLAD